MTHNAIIGLGSNIEPKRNIVRAKIIFAQKFQVLAESTLLVTKPVGKINQPKFINGTVLITTKLNYKQLKTELRKIEEQLGRTMTSDKFSPRTIDLDIIVWDEKIVDKDFYERDFLKKLTLQLQPDLKY